MHLFEQVGFVVDEAGSTLTCVPGRSLWGATTGRVDSARRRPCGCENAFTLPAHEARPDQFTLAACEVLAATSCRDACSRLPLKSCSSLRDHPHLVGDCTESLPRRFVARPRLLLSP